MLIEIVFLMTGISYAFLIGWFTVGWYRLPAFWPKEQAVKISFSVIVPVRNEEKNIRKLLESLRWQKYPRENFEVIVVDDHSADFTVQLVEQMLASGMYPNFRFILASDFSEKTGKKNALALGVRNARNSWIVTTDADCIIGRHWLQTNSDFIVSQSPDMVIGQVVIANGQSLFSQMQALELMSLSGASAGAAAIGRPIMCSGANLAFRKDLFEKAGGYQGNEQFASGDDMFLLHKFKTLPGVRISFLKSHGAIVYTKAAENLKDFFRQRSRWAGKAGGYRDGFTIATGLVVAFINVLIVSGIVLGVIFSEKLAQAALLLLVFKAVIDFPLLFSVTGYLRKRPLMWLYPALSLVYPFYVAATLASGFLTRPKWKY